MSEQQFSLGFDNATLPESVPVKPPKSRAPKAARPVVCEDIASKEEQAQLLEQDPDYRVLRRLVPTLNFKRQPRGVVQRVIVLDTETTGLDLKNDKIIELALLRIELDTSSGLPCGEVQVYDGLEDPGQPISKEIEAITGISNEMVQGQRLDLKRIAELIAGVDLVIAHNAAFDRPFVESRLPQFKGLAWGCSLADIDWKAQGHGSSKLEYLAQDLGFFYAAHRAEIDCHALLAVLSKPLPMSGLTGFAQILAAAQTPRFRLQATGSPFEAKDTLKARAYRWNAEQRVWQIQLADEALLLAEMEWLKQTVYKNRPAQVQIEKLDAKANYSVRSGLLSTQNL